MLKKSLVIVFLFIFICQFVWAFETDIEINTVSNNSISINFLNPESKGFADFKFNTTTIPNTGDGLVDIKFVNDAPVFHLEIFLMDRSGVIIHEKFENLNAEDDISLILFPGIPKESMIELDSQKVVEQVVEESVIIEENKTTEKAKNLENDTTITGNVAVTNSNNETENSTGFLSKIIGLAVGDGDAEENPYTKFIFYFIGAFVLFGVLFFVVGRIRKNIKHSGTGSDKKEDSRPTKKEEKDDDDDEGSYYKDAESKMAQAETEIRIADDAKRLKEMRERLTRDKEYLRRIRGE